MKQKKETKSIHRNFDFTSVFQTITSPSTQLLVKRLGVGGGGGNVSVTSSLVRAGGLLQRSGIFQVGGTSGVVGSGVVTDEVEFVGEAGEHSVEACADRFPKTAVINAAAAYRRLGSGGAAMRARQQAPQRQRRSTVPPRPSGRSCSDFTKSHFVARAGYQKHLNQNEAENENRVGHLTLCVKCLSERVGVCRGSRKNKSFGVDKMNFLGLQQRS